MVCPMKNTKSKTRVVHIRMQEKDVALIDRIAAITNRPRGFVLSRIIHDAARSPDAQTVIAEAVKR